MDLVASLPGTGEKRRSLLAGVFVHWHLLSLDAPTVAVLWAWTVAREVGAPIAWSTLAVLGIGTWLIYVGDRLLDGLPGAPRTDLRERHRFHARHRQALLIAGGVALVPLLWLIVARMPGAARREDVWVFAIAMVYAAAVHLPFLRIRFPRELVVAVVFASACAVPAWSVAGYAHDDLAVLVVLFAALCWLNCSAIHAWERESGSGNARPALSRWPLVSLLAMVIALASGVFVLLALHNPGELRLAAVLFASSMLFFALDRDFRRSLKRGPADGIPSPLAMRVLADAVLLTPLLLLIPWPK
ncbi:MAG TPA: hypothetical protein VHX37_18210 [Acidobacteriaceae bacterium]|nr:hypothetical protein [Acidobacteriaceae bacterium]